MPLQLQVEVLFTTTASAFALCTRLQAAKQQQQLERRATYTSTAGNYLNLFKFAKGCHGVKCILEFHWLVHSWNFPPVLFICLELFVTGSEPVTMIFVWSILQAQIEGSRHFLSLFVIILLELFAPYFHAYKPPWRGYRFPIALADAALSQQHERFLHNYQHFSSYFGGSLCSQTFRLEKHAEAATGRTAPQWCNGTRTTPTVIRDDHPSRKMRTTCMICP